MIYFFVGKREAGRHQKYILVRVQKNCSENICIVEIFFGGDLFLGLYPARVC